jgi:hypothetical protein
MMQHHAKRHCSTTRSSTCPICNQQSITKQEHEHTITRENLNDYRFTFPSAKIHQEGGVVCESCYEVFRDTNHANDVKLKRFTGVIDGVRNMNAEDTTSAYEWTQKCVKFKLVDRIEYENVTDELIDEYLYRKGEPLVLTNTTQSLASSLFKKYQGENPSEYKKKLERLFTLDFLKYEAGDTEIIPRDNTNINDLDGWTLKDYIEYLQTPRELREPKYLYGKDITCPDAWSSFLFNNERLYDRFRYKGNMDVSGDINPELRAISMMVYVGDKGSYTPGHQDICGSLGHNLMVYADRKGTNPIQRILNSSESRQSTDDKKLINNNKGVFQRRETVPWNESYALWCVFRPCDAADVDAVWRSYGSHLGDDNCFIPLPVIATSGVETILVEQRVGDLILLPPRAPHQVLNQNGRTAKIAWNTLTAKCIEGSYDILNEYRKVGKDQTYRVKSVAYYALMNRVGRVNSGNYTKTLLEEFLPLLKIVKDVLFSEWIDSEHYDPATDKPYRLNNDILPHSLVCDSCRCDIFNRCFHCKECVSGDGTLGIEYCLECYAAGRGCSHRDRLILSEHVSMTKCMETFEKAKKSYIQLKNYYDKKFKFTAAMLDEMLMKKQYESQWSIATIAYNMHKAANENTVMYCHQCRTHHPKQSMFICQCETNYCASCLWNRYGCDIVDKLKQKKVSCPMCQNLCNCVTCLDERHLNRSLYESKVSAAIASVKKIEPFNDRRIYNARDGSVSGPCDDQPDCSKGYSNKRKLSSSKLGTGEPRRKRMKSLASIAPSKKSEEEEKTKTVASQTDSRTRKCKTCQQQISGTIYVSKKTGKYYCTSCVNKLNTDELIKCTFNCDSCKSVILGARYHFSDSNKNFCDNCILTNVDHKTITQSGDLQIFGPAIMNEKPISQE